MIDYFDYLRKSSALECEFEIWIRNHHLQAIIEDNSIQVSQVIWHHNLAIVLLFRVVDGLFHLSRQICLAFSLSQVHFWEEKNQVARRICIFFQVSLAVCVCLACGLRILLPANVHYSKHVGIWHLAQISEHHLKWDWRLVIQMYLHCSIAVVKEA